MDAGKLLSGFMSEKAKASAILSEGGFHVGTKDNPESGACGRPPSCLGSAARAQDASRSRDVMQTIATAKGQAENLLALALYSNLSVENSKVIESANERIFASLTGVLSGIPAEEAILYTEPAQTMIAEQMPEHGVATFPEALTPVIPGGSSEGPGELIDVMGDIIKDAFGVKDLNVQGLTQVAEELALLDIMSRIGGMIRAKQLGARRRVPEGSTDPIGGGGGGSLCDPESPWRRGSQRNTNRRERTVCAFPRMADPDRFDPVCGHEAQKQASGRLGEGSLARSQRRQGSAVPVKKAQS